MPALAELQSSLPLRASRIVSSRPVCKICSDTMISAEASTMSDREVSYLWSCDNCGYGFVTKHDIKPFVCN
jgi:ribosomal protein L37AE/L43A